ncbi:SPOR domain-containing protein [Oceanobacillus chungangensis]|uniref:SPOR domain-containing protein n=1 Tax=Oceanobacillus chungangensis TaxID=1229152 RepID=A0A3D8PZN8_9BACI|nr:SPOR domain-containing protein [Oceanobacillus chungangensis]RDW21660.1 hypothetical protein CWR45_01950 [Oceanobacillus chungangensis]
MAKKKKVIIKQNGKVINQQKHQSIRKLADTNFYQGEQAATVQESEQDNVDEEVQTFASLKQPKMQQGKKTGRFRSLRTLLIAIGSAIIIGSVLSYVMFQIFVIVDGNQAADPGLATTPINQRDNQEAIPTQAHSLISLNAFVLQAGVFSNKTNADEWMNIFADAGLEAIVWEKDDQYFLFLGVAATKEQAKTIATGLTTEFDIFVKEWSTAEGEVKLTDGEFQFVQQFTEDFQTALSVLSDPLATLPENIFTEPSEQTVADSEILGSITSEISKINELTSTEANLSLLRLMNQYDQLLSQ